MLSLFILVTTFLSNCLGNSGNEKSQYPYKVIAIKNRSTILATSKEIAPLDSLRASEVIVIEDGSYIAFIDDAINVYEYFGPIIIKVDTLQGRSKRAVNKKQKLGSYPDLVLINSESPRPKEPFHDSNFEFQIYWPSPFSSGLVLTTDSILTVRWVDNTKYSHTFFLYDVFGTKPIERIALPPNEITIRLKKFSKAEKFFFFISREDNRRTGAISFEFSKNLKFDDVTIFDTSPASNFLTALFLEKNNLIEEAETYYLKASTLGNNIEFYHTSLLKFRKRWNR